MQIIDLDEERRRAEQYSDISRVAMICAVFALVLVLAFSFFMLWPSPRG